ncbi:hypothetical protein COV18_01080 [Candidatus Woesearchaeota archaeon CG10_big_fil_rev_8_21_14_0_10_37_12]|nr:MAG: hypothetical protein COV18_01080 [Candidatus Woesearchaeota archaeon CG10_big_fil_rev_8_21_14_0_10_37_12]
MIEQFETGKDLDRKEWDQYIDTLKTKTKPSTKEEVKQALVEAIKNRIHDQKFGVLLSGGVDSSLITTVLKKFTDNFICYSVGFEYHLQNEQHTVWQNTDLGPAKHLAEQLGVKFKYKIFSQKEIEKLIKKSAQIMNNPDLVNISVSSVILAAEELAKQDGINVLFGGLGSEEIFAGYQRHLQAENINEECWKGLKGNLHRDFARDNLLGKTLGLTVLVPFLDEQVILTAMGIPGEQKTNNTCKKIILREIAEELGVPKENAWRKRLAAQYGSGFDKALEKIAKEKKMNKTEYINSILP